MAPTSHDKSKKITNFGAPGWIFSVFYGFWEESKKRDFSMSLWVVKKSIKIEPWGAQGPPRGLRRFARGAVPAARGPTHASRALVMDYKAMQKETKDMI